MGGLFSKDVDDKIPRTKDVNENIVKSVFEILECRACLESCQAPIFTCVIGHVLCSDCKEKVEQCPVCGVPGTPSTRNLPLDTLSDRVLTVPCKFQPKGCGVKRNREEDLEVHYRNCRYKPAYKCMLQGYTCDFVGNAEELYDHAQMKHSENVLLITDIIPDSLKLVGFPFDNTEFTMIVKGNDENEYFWISCRRISTSKIVFFSRYTTNKIMFFSRYIGPDVHACSFKVNLAVAPMIPYSPSLPMTDPNEGRNQTYKMSPLALGECALGSKNAIELDFDPAPDGDLTVIFSVLGITKM